MQTTLHSVFVGFAAGLCILAYLFPYFELPGIWWRAIPSTLAILGLGALAHGKGAVTFFGLRMSCRQLLVSVMMCIVGIIGFRFVVLPLVTNESFTVTLGENRFGHAHQFFQVFNDELVVRAAVLTLLLRFFPHPKLVVVAVAALFSVAHHVFYRMTGTSIDWPALVSLFSFGAIANVLFVRFGHIGYGVALHYAWNMYRFSGDYRLDGRPLSEGMTFNYVEGNVWVVLGSVVAFVITLLAYVRREGLDSRGSDIALGNTAQHEHASD